MPGQPTLELRVQTRGESELGVDRTEPKPEQDSGPKPGSKPRTDQPYGMPRGRVPAFLCGAQRGILSEATMACLWQRGISADYGVTNDCTRRPLRWQNLYSTILLSVTRFSGAD